MRSRAPAQATPAAKPSSSPNAKRKPHRAQHPYALRGCVWCALCGRRMQSHWSHDTPYYRCRFAAEYALANHVEHPLNVNLREDAVIGQVDRWLAREFAPHRLRDTISDLAAVQLAEPAVPVDNHGEPRSRSPSATAS